MRAPETIVEVHSREAMAAAIRQHAGTSCRIVWGSFSMTFRELLESEKVAEKVFVKDNPNRAGTWEWAGSRRAQYAKKSARRRCPFQEDTEDAAQAWEKMPRKSWPKN